MNAIDEDIQNAFKYKFAEKPRGGTNIAVVHINTNSSLDAVTKIHHQGVYITARLPSQDVKPDINMKSTKKLLKELDIPFIESSVPGYMHWVSQSVLKILSS